MTGSQSPVGVTYWSALAGAAETRAVRIVSVATGVALTLPRFLLNEGASGRPGPLLVLALTCWWLLPLAVYVWSVRCRVALWIGPLAYLVVTARTIQSGLTPSGGSAALFVVPLYLGIAVVVVAKLERLARNRFALQATGLDEERLDPDEEESLRRRRATPK